MAEAGKSEETAFVWCEGRSLTVNKFLDPSPWVDSVKFWML